MPPDHRVQSAIDAVAAAQLKLQKAKTHLAEAQQSLQQAQQGHAAAQRELQEEAGFAAKELTPLRQISLSPSYMGNQIQYIIAEGLYPSSLPGDEPEPLAVVPLLSSGGTPAARL